MYSPAQLLFGSLLGAGLFIAGWTMAWLFKPVKTKEVIIKTVGEPASAAPPNITPPAVDLTIKPAAGGPPPKPASTFVTHPGNETQIQREEREAMGLLLSDLDLPEK